MESEKPKERVIEKSRIDVKETQSTLPIPSDTSSNIDQDYEHLEAIVLPQFHGEHAAKRKTSFTQLEVFCNDDCDVPLLDIIDDHFGKSNTDIYLTQSLTKMTRSADPVLFNKSEDRVKRSHLMKTKADLTSSEIITSDTKLKCFVEMTKAKEDTPPADMAPPKPPKRTKTIKKFKKEAEFMQYKLNNLNTSNTNSNALQCLYEVLFYYNHEDPVLRTGVQTIIGHYIRSTQAKLCVNSQVNLQYLLAILCMVSCIHNLIFFLLLLFSFIL